MFFSLQSDKDNIDKPKAFPSYEELLRESELDEGVRARARACHFALIACFVNGFGG